MKELSYSIFVLFKFIPSGAESCIYELIKKGAVVNATNYLGSTPLHYSCQRGHHKAAVSCCNIHLLILFVFILFTKSLC